MPSYLMLLTWTEQGVRTAKDTVKRAEAFRAAAGRMGITVREQLWTMGPYDAVALFDAPGDEAASTLAISIGSQGNVRTLTMRCYTAAEMARILEGI